MSERLESPEHARARLAQASMTDRERAELWARLAQDTAHRGSRRRLLALAIASAAAAIALWLGLSEPTAPSTEVAALQRPDPCALDASASTLRAPDHCASTTVQVAGDDWRLERGAEVARVGRLARVVRGRVRFTVRPRKQAGERPFVVQVSHAEIRVIGTVFEVDQREGRGAVHVTEGVVELIWPDGERQRVSAGEHASWPRPVPVPAPVPENLPADAGPRRPDKGVDLEAVMDRLLVLRSQRRFGEAVVLLRTTLGKKGLASAQRERISQELGFALEADGAPSCAHWVKHGETFKSERTKALVEKKLRACEPK